MAEKHFAVLGKDCIIQESVILGLKYTDDCKETLIGNNAVIRAFTVIYADSTIGDDFRTGHFVTIRENTKIGNNVVVGSGVVIDGNMNIGDRVKIETNAYIPAHTRIGNDVFIGPNVVMANDKYPQKMRGTYKPAGPLIEDNVSIGANSTILPEIIIGTGSFVAAGTVVTKNIPPRSLVKGNPGAILPLPEKLNERNRAKQW
ncbi:MAG: acetyltransferase [Nitrospirota bacterium]|nr:acetyltransferase [Nitrospirota bacterium]